MLNRFSVFFSMMACLSSVQEAAAGSQSANVLSTHELKSALAISQAKFESVYFDYRVDDAYAGNDRFPPGTYLRRIVIAKAPNLFSHETAHGSDHLAWEKDPRRRHCIVENGEVFDSWITSRAYNWTPDWKAHAPLPGSMPGEPIILITGIWPLTAREAPKRHGQPIMLCDVAQSDRFFVRVDLESVDGQWCHVLENPFVDCLWLDVDRGCALVARNLYDVEKGELLARHELKDHREIAPGIWLPSSIRTTTYDHLAEDPMRRKRIVSDSNMQINTIRVNDADDTLFIFDPKPGSLWLNPPKEQSLNPIQTHPHGTDHLDDIVAWAQAILSDQPPASRPTAWLSWVAAGLFGFGLFFLVEFFFQPRVANTSDTPTADANGVNP